MRRTSDGAAGFAVLALLAMSGCRSKTPPGYQGVVELEERVTACEVPGRLREVLVRRGDVVVDGAELARLDDTLAKLTRDAREQDEKSARAELSLLEAGSRREDIESVAAEVRGALAQVTFARKTASHARALGAAGSIANMEVEKDDAELARAAAEHRALERKLHGLKQGARPEEVAAAKARVASLTLETALEEERLARHVLRAKGAGMVVDVNVAPGELAAVGTPAVTIADVTHPYIDVFVPQGELEGIRLGSKAEVRVDASRATVHGAVEYVAPRTEFTPRFLFSEQERPHLVVRVRVRAEDQGEALHAGVPAFVVFTRVTGAAP